MSVKILNIYILTTVFNPTKTIRRALFRSDLYSLANITLFCCVLYNLLIPNAYFKGEFRDQIDSPFQFSCCILYTASRIYAQGEHAGIFPRPFPDRYKRS